MISLKYEKILLNSCQSFDSISLMRKNMPTNSLHPETLVLHSGSYRSDQQQIPLLYLYTRQQVTNLAVLKMLVICLVKTATFHWDHDPTNAVLEEKWRPQKEELLLWQCHQVSRIYVAIQNLCRAGDNIVASTDLYGGHGIYLQIR